MSPEPTVPSAGYGNCVAVCGARGGVWLGSILSAVIGVWALLSMASPFGLIAGTAAALLGLAFGVLAAAAHARGSWRKTALVGIATSGLALFIAAAEVLYALVLE
jgi:membrane associated rhomboid family serine protease